MLDLMMGTEEQITCLRDYCLDASSQFISLMSQTGCHMVSNGDSPAGPELISSEMYVQYALPYEKKLAEAEARLKDFKLRNIDLQLSEGKGLTARVYDINAELSRARQEVREAENSRDALRRQIAGEAPTLSLESHSAAPDITVPELDGRIEAQKRSLDALLRPPLRGPVR